MTTNLHQLPGPSSELLGDAFPPLVLVSLVKQGGPDKSSQNLWQELLNNSFTTAAKETA